MASNAKQTWNGAEAARILDCNYWRLRDWATKGLLRPARIRRAVLKPGSKRAAYQYREYTFTDLAAARTLMRLANTGLSNAVLRRIVATLRGGGHELESSTLVVSGNDVFLDRGKSLQSLVANPGQHADRVLILSPVSADVAALRERVEMLDFQREASA